MINPVSRKMNKLLITTLAGVLALIFLFPLVFTIADSFMSEGEITENYGIIAQKSISNLENDDKKFADLKLIPDVATFKQYYTVLVKKIKFLVMFWNSVIMVFPILLGQIIVSSMAAYAFSKMSFKWRDRLFFIYIVVMLMPFQVTLVPNYIVADKLGLIDKYQSIILPGIFTTFGTFLLRQFMVYIPDQYCEAARADGGSHLDIFFKVILPMSKTGIAALGILSLIDYWNMVEQPLIFLQDIGKQPLSVYLSVVNDQEKGIAFAASTLYMLPMLLIFLYGESYLIEGIQLSGLKG